MRDLETQMLRFIDASASKVDFRQLKKHFCGPGTRTDQALKQALANLVSAGVLCYTFHFGRSFIERSLNHPIQVSPHVILKPLRCVFEGSDGDIVVSIESGASFGGGDHPTTRMAIQLIDHWIRQPCWGKSREELKAIDIGTGSGVLSIVAAKLGLGIVYGVDTDPCSIFEAQKNVSNNQLNGRILIREGTLSGIDEQFDLVLANLRPPTLISLCEELDQKLNSTCGLVLSGMKTEETDSVRTPYQKKGFRVVDKRQEKGWGAICLLRG